MTLNKTIDPVYLISAFAFLVITRHWFVGTVRSHLELRSACSHVQDSWVGEFWTIKASSDRFLWWVYWCTGLWWRTPEVLRLRPGLNCCWTRTKPDSREHDDVLFIDVDVLINPPWSWIFFFWCCSDVEGRKVYSINKPLRFICNVTVWLYLSKLIFKICSAQL